MERLQYLTTAETLANGDHAAPKADKMGGLITSPTGKYTNVTSATTAYIKTGPGILQKIVVNTTAAGTITLYDSLAASGTKIGTLKASVAEGDYPYDVEFTTGLTIVTGAASDITVTYR